MTLMSILKKRKLIFEIDKITSSDKTFVFFPIDQQETLLAR